MKFLKYSIRILLDLIFVNKYIKIYLNAKKYSLLDLMYILNDLSIMNLKFVELGVINSDFNFLYNDQLIDSLNLFQIDYNLKLIDNNNAEFSEIDSLTQKNGIYLNLNIKKSSLSFHLNSYYLKWAHNYLKANYSEKICIVCDEKPKFKKKNYEYIELDFFRKRKNNTNFNIMQKFSILKNSDGYYGSNKTIIFFCKTNNIDVLKK